MLRLEAEVTRLPFPWLRDTRKDHGRAFQPGKSVCVCVCPPNGFSPHNTCLQESVQLCDTAARQAPLSEGRSRKEHWSGVPCPSLGVLPTQGSNLGLPCHRQIPYHLSLTRPKTVRPILGPQAGFVFLRPCQPLSQPHPERQETWGLPERQPRDSSGAQAQELWAPAAYEPPPRKAFEMLIPRSSSQVILSPLSEMGLGASEFSFR